MAIMNPSSPQTNPSASTKESDRSSSCSLDPEKEEDDSLDDNSTDDDNPNDPEPSVDQLGIYTGRAADAVLGRSHARWEHAVQAAERTPHGDFPDSAFNLEGLLLRIPALPTSIPSDAESIEGYSTWTNSDTRCSLRQKTRRPHSVYLRSACPFTLTTSTSGFKVWSGTPNNGVSLLILAWAYILNASLAEKQNLRLRFESAASDAEPTTTAHTANPTRLDLSYTTQEEGAWWTIITTPRLVLSADGLNGLFLPWSLQVADLGGLELGGRDKLDFKLPSASQAAAYLARFCSAYNLRHQSSVALAAALCFAIHRESGTLSVPIPRFSQGNLAPVSTEFSYPPEFRHLSYFMTLSLSDHALQVTLESLLWEPDVPCNHAGHWLRPIRNILGPIVEAGNRELLAKAIAFSPARAAPLWLGTLLCGEYPRLLHSIDWYQWCARTAVDAAAWTGIPRSFLALPSPSLHMQDGTVSRADIWKLRHDLQHLYNEDDYTLEPLGPFCPFGVMRQEDIELELHDHLGCHHQWTYNHWTWKHASAEDIGFSPTGGPYAAQSGTEEPAQLARFVGLAQHYCGRADVRAIRRVCRISTENTFKWCDGQVEKGFANRVVPHCRGSNQVPASGESEHSSIDSERIGRWVADVDRAGVGLVGIVHAWSFRLLGAYLGYSLLWSRITRGIF